MVTWNMTLAMLCKRVGGGEKNYYEPIAGCRWVNYPPVIIAQIFISLAQPEFLRAPQTCDPFGTWHPIR